MNDHKNAFRAGAFALAAGFLLATAVAIGAGDDHAPNASHAESTVLDRQSDPLSTDPRVDRIELRGAPTTSAYSAPVGQAMWFAFEGSFVTTMGTEETPEQTTIRQTLRGSMHAVVLGRRNREILLGVSWPDTRVVVTVTGGRADPSAGEHVARDLARETLVRMKDDGATLAYRFPPEMDVENRNQVRALVSAFRFVIQDDAGTEWTTEETDPTGRCAVRYRRKQAGAILKQRLSYLAADTARPAPAVDGYTEGVLSQRVGWLESARHREQIDAIVPDAGIAIRQTARASIRLTRVTTTSRAIDDARWQGPWSGQDGHEDVRGLGQQRQADQFRAALAGVSLEALLAELAQLMHLHGGDSAEVFATRRKLAWLVRLRPDALPRLRQLLAGMDEDTASVVLGAVGSAGTGPAQQLLAGLFADRAGRAAHRFAAAQAMFQLGSPEPAAQLALRNVLRDPTTSSTLRAAGMLLLGTFAARNVTPDQHTALLADLLSAEHRAARAGMLEAWLEALGNTAEPAALAAASRHLRHDRSSVRAAALAAIRDVHTQQSRALLVRAARGDAAVVVRLRAVELLADRRGGEVTEVLAHVLVADANADVRRAAVFGLAGRAKSDAAVAAVLRRAAAKDPSANVRAAARRALQD